MTSCKSLFFFTTVLPDHIIRPLATTHELKKLVKRHAIEHTKLNCSTFFNMSGGLSNRMLSIFLGIAIVKPSSSFFINQEPFMGTTQVATGSGSNSGGSKDDPRGKRGFMLPNNSLHSPNISLHFSFLLELFCALPFLLQHPSDITRYCRSFNLQAYFMCSYIRAVSVNTQYSATNFLSNGHFLVQNPSS